MSSRICFLFVICACSTNNNTRVESEITWEQTTAEVVECHYLKLDNAQPLDVGRFTVDFPLGSHHVHLYRSELPAPDHVEDCSAGIDWQRWRLLVAVQTEPLDWHLPDGVATRIEPHQQLMVQVHWLNATGKPLHPTIHIGLESASQPKSQMGALLAVSQDVAMDPGEAKSVGSWVELPEGAQLLRAMGHYHDRGHAYGAARMLRGADEGQSIYKSLGSDNFEFASLLDQPPISPGEGIDYHCDFENDTGGTISWGANVLTQEHCNLALYYFLPTGTASSQVFISGALAKLVTERERASVVLTRPAGFEGVEVRLASSNPSILRVPARIRVPAWADHANFDLERSEEGSVRISATTGAGTVEAIVP